MTSSEVRKIAILGAGPIGLEAAHALSAVGYEVEVFDQGPVGASIRRWGHIRLFSPWALNTSALGLGALDDLDLPRPDAGGFPTGAEFVARYLEPLARHPRLKGRVHTGSRVVSVGRQGVLKGELIASRARREQPFRLLIEDAEGNERIVLAQIVIDATGCWGNPNALGDAGIPALGERKAASAGRIIYTLPDCCGADAEQFAGRHVAVVGAGYSAITNLKALIELQARAQGTRITWLTRKAGAPYVRIEGDPLPERDALSALGNALMSGRGGDVDTLAGVSVTGIEVRADGSLSLSLLDEGGQPRALDGVDVVVANVGFRPDASITRELQVHQCYASEGPMKLAAALLSASGSGGDCLAQTSMGADTLKSPEPDFFVLGAKSYGRGSSFLIKLGLEQIEDVKSLLSI